MGLWVLWCVKYVGVVGESGCGPCQSLGEELNYDYMVRVDFEYVQICGWRQAAGALPASCSVPCIARACLNDAIMVLLFYAAI